MIARLGLVLFGLPLAAQYVPYLTDTFPTAAINSTNWWNSGLSGGSSGLYGNGAIRSNLTPPDGTSDYEVTVKLKNFNPADQKDIRIWLRTSHTVNCFYPNFVSLYEIRFRNTGQLTVLKNDWSSGAAVGTQLLSTVVTLHTGTIIRASIRSDGPLPGIRLSIDGIGMYIADSTLATGAPAVGFCTQTNSGQGIERVDLGPIDRQAPGAPQNLIFVAHPTSINLFWNAASDDPSGRGVWRYHIFRDGAYHVSTTRTDYLDDGLGYGEAHQYAVFTEDWHGNVSSAYGAVAATTELEPVEPRRTGVLPNGSYWGAMGEQIDVLSGNLNYSIKLLSAVARGSMSVDFKLSYNSQNWSQENGITTRYGADVGYGFGWRLMAGSIIWANNLYIFTDSNGTEHRLTTNANGIWTGNTGLYVSYDENLHRVYSNNGSFWQMDSISASSEQDAGTRYPTLMQDSNGNQIILRYRPAIGLSTENTSARINDICDIRSTQVPGPGGIYVWRSFLFTYNSDAVPHLQTITSQIYGLEQYSFNYTAPVTLNEPFSASTSFVPASQAVPMLQSVTMTGSGIGHQFDYQGNSGELIKITFPYKGELIYGYTTASLMGRQVREVNTRDIVKQPNAAATRHALFRDAGDPSRKIHLWGAMVDSALMADKVWVFSPALDYTMGFVVAYWERSYVDMVSKVGKGFTWALTSSGVPYIRDVWTALDMGTPNEKASATRWTADGYGNVTKKEEWDYGIATPVRVTDCTYKTDPAYLARYLRSLPTSCVLTADGTQYNLFSYQYDQLNDPTPPVVIFHDSVNYSSSFWTRGNLSNWSTLGQHSGTAYHNMTGATKNFSADGVIGVATLDANSNLPVSISQAGVQTTLSYAPSLAVLNVTTSNGPSTSFTYDAYARPATQTTPDGTLQMSYTDATTVVLATKTATNSVNQIWTKTYFDGFGRTVKVETGNASGAASISETEYAPCACSPLGKVSKVSRPHTPNATPVWTTYTYDAVGRTLTVSQPGGAGTTTYSYLGNQTMVSDPSGRWKKYTTDAFGNLVQVNEPDPQGGADYVTTYTYNALNKLTQVSMPRSGYTQVRHFAYNTSAQLTSETHPETGTSTYTYGQYGQIATKIDAKNQRTEWSYDGNGRVTQERHYNPSNQEATCERIDYRYDSVSSGVGINVVGRLAEISWGNADQAVCGGALFLERYGYDNYGRPSRKSLSVTQNTPIYTGVTQTIEAAWDYHNGQMRALSYPYVSGWRRAYQYSFDSMGRQSGLTDTWNQVGTSIFQNAQYGTRGELTQVAYGGTTESRNYNSLGQLTGISYNGTLRHEYRYSPTANDGRISSYKDWQSGEDVQYQYDSLARLSSAQTLGPDWGQSFGYDGFGNVVSKTVTKGSATTLNVIADPATNRISGIPHDANGNVTNLSGVGSMAYDGRNRYVGDTSGGQKPTRGYDPMNRKIWVREHARSLVVDFYLPNGINLGTYRFVWEFTISIPPYVQRVRENSYLGQRLIRVDTGSSAPLTVTYPMLDRLGSTVSHLPYGDERNPTAQERVKFATYHREASGVVDYAMNRYYSPVYGRFTSPDPVASANPSNPGSWNRYAYVEGDPVNKVDPTGLYAEAACGDSWATDASLSGPCSGDNPMGGKDPNISWTNWHPGIFTQHPSQGTYQITLTGDQTSLLQGYGFLPGILPPLAGAGAGGGLIIIAGGPVSWTIAAGGAVVIAGIALYQMGVFDGIFDSKVPTVDELKTKCNPVGEPVVVPSTRRGNRDGGQSIEQEYECPDGTRWTIHTVVDGKGNIVLPPHVRPGSPKH